MAMQDIITTSNPVHEYKYSWTIENASKVTRLRGPPLAPVNGFPLEVCLELYLNIQTNTFADFSYNHSLYLYVYLIKLKGKPLYVSSYTALSKTDNENFQERFFPARELGTERLCLIEFRKLSVESSAELLDNILVVKGALSFSGHDINSSISLSKNNPEALKELLIDLRSLYESNSSSDISFSVDDQTLRAHKAVLCGRSPVFAKMFDHDMQESNSNNVVIVDANFQTFNSFLVFLYTGSLEDNSWDTVLSLYSLAHKYQVKSLLKTCSDILGSGLTIDSVLSVLVLSDLQGDKELKDVAIHFIRDRILQVAASSEWVEIVTTKPQLAKEILG